MWSKRLKDKKKRKNINNKEEYKYFINIKDEFEYFYKRNYLSDVQRYCNRKTSVHYKNKEVILKLEQLI